MKKMLFSSGSAAAAVLLLAGCTSVPPAPEPEPPAVVQPEPAPEPAPAPLPVDTRPSLLIESEEKADALRTAGALAAVGSGESRSLNLAMNYAKKNGRIQLIAMTTDRIETIAKSFSEETGIPYDSLLLTGFNNCSRALADKIAGSIAGALRYEPSGDGFTAYAVMILDPAEIEARLQQEPELYTRLQNTQALHSLQQQIKRYRAFTAPQP